MNWVIKNSQKLLFHTDLKTLLFPIENDIQNFKWFFSDLEINTSELDKIPINHNEDFFNISNYEMNLIRNSDTQIIWGVISAIELNQLINIDLNNLPFADGNDKVWSINNFQIEGSIIEIIAWDSSYTIIKFRNKNLSDKFKKYFDEAIPLEKFK